MTGSLCSLGVSVNIQPIKTQFKSHTYIINVSVQDKVCYCTIKKKKKILPGPLAIGMCCWNHASEDVLGCYPSSSNQATQ